jgi:hypothetical protein
MSDTEIKMEPDAAMIRRHVGHLFEGWLDGCYDGRIELAWTDGRDGRLKYASIFGTDQLDQLVERAVTENRKEGQNVYIGQALRKPNIAPFGRCFFFNDTATTEIYTDIDDDIVLACAKYRNLGCWPPPWSSPASSAPARADAVAAQCTAARSRCMPPAKPGDRSGARWRYAVVNPSRVLRLADRSPGRARKVARRADRAEVVR